MVKNPVMPPSLAVLFLHLSISLSLHADPFEGYIHLSQGGLAPIWLDLQVPKSDGPVTGTYFYKKVGKEIHLKGEAKGAVLRLSEYDAKQAVTGLFTLTRFNDSLVGAWNSPKDTTKQKVKVYRANPEDKVFAKMPKPAELILSEGKTLAQEIKENKDGEEDKKSKGPSIDPEFFRKGVLSLSYSIEYMGAYPTGIGTYHTFDLTGKTKKEIVLHNEIDPKQRKKFYGLLRQKIQAELTAYRKDFTDEEWSDVFGSRLEEGGDDPDSVLNSMFLLPKDPDSNKATVDTSTIIQTTNDSSGDHYYFTDEGLQYHVSHYWGFPHVIQAQDFGCRNDFSYADLKKYLKKGSPLARLAPKSIP